MLRRVLPLLCLITGSVVGCTDLGDYHGTFRGGVVGSDNDGCEPGATCSFLRKGFPEGTQLILTDFRPPPTAGPAGRVSTSPYDAFADTELLQIGPLEHDQLSLLDFPGEGRLRSFIFTARADSGPVQGRDAMFFVSLMEDNAVEVRVLVGHGDESVGDHFGLFVLRKE